MYCNPKLKLNKFKKVAIPSNAAYFARLGQIEAASSLYDDNGNERPHQGNKLDVLAAMDEFDRIRQAEEASASNVNE